MIVFNSMFQILGLLIIMPLLIIITVYLIYIRSEKKKDLQTYRFKRDFWSSMISVFYGSMLFSLSLGYAVNVILKIKELSLETKYSWIIIGVILLVILTFIFFAYTFIKYMKVVKNKDDYFKKEGLEYVG